MGREERAVEFRVRGVTTVPPSECIIVLEEVRGARLLPIHSGGFEAQSLTLALSGLKLPRPLTHDMVLSVVQALGWTLRRVTVCDLSESVFYARVDFEKDGVRTSIDARPSDAINVAVRAGCPIFVDESVLARVDAFFKPIDADDLADFRDRLREIDPAKVFDELEGKNAPREPGGPD